MKGFTHDIHGNIPMSVNSNTPLVRALALQSCGRNCSLDPDLVLWKPIVQHMLFSGGVFFFHRHR